MSANIVRNKEARKRERRMDLPKLLSAKKAFVTSGPKDNPTPLFDGPRPSGIWGSDHMISDIRPERERSDRCGLLGSRKKQKKWGRERMGDHSQEVGGYDQFFANPQFSHHLERKARRVRPKPQNKEKEAMNTKRKWKGREIASCKKRRWQKEDTFSPMTWPRGSKLKTSVNISIASSEYLCFTSPDLASVNGSWGLRKRKEDLRIHRPCSCSWFRDCRESRRNNQGREVCRRRGEGHTRKRKNLDQRNLRWRGSDSCQGLIKKKGGEGGEKSLLRYVGLGRPFSVKILYKS